MNNAEMDPYLNKPRYTPPMSHRVGELRDMAEQEGVADVFPDEGNFVLGALNRLVDENAYTEEERDQTLLEYVRKYLV